MDVPPTPGYSDNVGTDAAPIYVKLNVAPAVNHSHINIPEPKATLKVISQWTNRFR